LLLTGVAWAETMVFKPGVDEGKDAEIDNKQGGTPHGSHPYILKTLGG
jgi:hypothetical protein